jgi:hypothetical protein
MKKITISSCFALLVFSSFAQLPTGDPVQAGLSKEGLKRVETFLASQTDQKI